MSVRRLLEEMDSYELSAWQAFLDVDASAQRMRRKQWEQDAKVLGDDTEVIRHG